MVIQQTTATWATSATGKLFFKRQADTALAEKTADTTTISQAAQERLAFEKASGLQIPDELVSSLEDRSFFSLFSEKTSALSTQSTSQYRVDGPVYAFEDLLKNKDLPLITVKMTEAQINEAKLGEQQKLAREIVNFNYAKAHQYQPVGQVLANGKLVATVFDSGSVESPRAIPELNNQNLSPADRLVEIARSVKGEIIYSNFLPTMNGWSGPSAPESALPPFTARSFGEIIQQELIPAMEKKIAEWEEQTGRKYPRPS